MMNNITSAILIFLGTIAMICIIALLMGFPIMWLWNYAMVAIGLPEITFWVAVCINILAGILFNNPKVNSIS